MNEGGVNNTNWGVLLITWVSASWKSTIVKKLKEKYGFSQPIQFTTRPPRNEAEKDEYVFLTKSAFLKKLENGDFAEFTNYNWNYYALTKYFPKGNSVVIVDNAWKAQIEIFLRLEGRKYKSLFLTIPPDEMVRRLTEFRKSSVAEIRQRFDDFKRFSSEGFDYVLDANRNIDVVFSKVEEALRSFGFIPKP